MTSLWESPVQEGHFGKMNFFCVKNEKYVDHHWTHLDLMHLERYEVVYFLCLVNISEIKPEFFDTSDNKSKHVFSEKQKHRSRSNPRSTGKST